MLARMWSNRNSLAARQNHTATMEDSLAIPYKTKHTLPYSNHTPWDLSKRTENSCPHKNLNQLIHNYQNMEATKTS